MKKKTHTDEMVAFSKREYDTERTRYLLIKTIKQDLVNFEKQGLIVDYYFSIDTGTALANSSCSPRITFTIKPAKKDWDATEDFIADISIANSIPFTRMIHGNYPNNRPEAYFHSHGQVILPKSKIPVSITIKCGQYIPPECIVKYESRRTWSNEGSYRYSCALSR
jgi:hypothetical protein